MLVLTRKLNEKIVIGDSIEVMIVEIRPDRVRLGIAADKSVPVHREEVYRAIQAEQDWPTAGGSLAPTTPK